MKGSAYSWIIILVSIGIFGMVYFIFQPLMDDIVFNETAGTINLTNSTAARTMNYGQTLWYLLPLIMLIALGIWGASQANRPDIGG